MIVIIPDTNILAASPKLLSPAWRSLLEHGDEWRIQFVVPDVVLLETIDVVCHHWRAEKDKLNNLRLRTFNVDNELEEIRDAIRRHIDTYKESLEHRLAEFGARIFPVPPVGHLEIARRASGRVPPYQGETKDGYRDTLIWLTVMAVADEYSEDEIWFVSENTKDFGPKPPNWTGPNAGTPKDCPILFNADLYRELDARGLSARVRLVTSLENLEQHLAALHAPISAEDLKLLDASLDYDAMNQLLELVPEGTEITPSEAALNPNVTRAFLNHLKVHNPPWKFSDAARRGEGRWTANYSVDVQAEIITSTGTGETAVVAKALRLSGIITIKAPTEVEDLSVTTMSALPDDPDRALWETLPQSYLNGLDAFRASQNAAEILKAAAAFQTPPGFAEMLKNASGPAVPEILKAAAALQTPPGIAEMLNASPGAQVSVAKTVEDRAIGETDKVEHVGETNDSEEA